MIPFPKTKTRRTDLAQLARKNLDTYRRLAAIHTSSENAVKALLFAEAQIQRALYLETRGQMGALHADAQSIIHDQKMLRTYLIRSKP